jgi:hypothetical protein
MFANSSQPRSSQPQAFSGFFDDIWSWLTDFFNPTISVRMPSEEEEYVAPEIQLPSWPFSWISYEWHWIE